MRIEIGPRDVTAGTVVTARRDMPGKPGKQFGVPAGEEALLPHVAALLDEVQEGMLAAAVAFRDRWGGGRGGGRGRGRRKGTEGHAGSQAGTHTRREAGRQGNRRD